MLDRERVYNKVREVIEIEIEGLRNVLSQLERFSFYEAVKIVYETKGRVIVSGVGKSGIVGRKISATLSSLGTPSIFLHPVEALHGDLGLVTKEDSLIAISNSGETSELVTMVSIVKNRGIPVIAMTGAPESTLARISDAVIYCGVMREACSLGLAPTASTTATLAMGDALSVVLLECKNFSKEDFRNNHPGGTLGERLRLKVKDVMLSGSAIPVVRVGTLMLEALNELNQKKLGAVLIVNNEHKLCGIITDGDVRRAIIRMSDIKGLDVTDVMTKNPKVISEDNFAHEALDLMERFLITVLPVVDDQMGIRGIVHLHDLLGKGKLRFV